MMTWWQRLTWPGPLGVLEILVLSVGFYIVIRVFRGTPGANALFGLAVVVTVLLAVTRLARLETLNWVLRQVSLTMAVGLLILFQPELRRALAEVGRRHFFWAVPDSVRTIQEVVNAVHHMAERRIGALIAFERQIGTRAYQTSGVRLEARVSSELLETIFLPRSLLHDGGVIIAGHQIVAAGCLFPLSEQSDIHRSLGTRHRAALGITEETDAVCLVVSEEDGTISVCEGGHMRRDVKGAELQRLLTERLIGPTRPASPWARRLVEWVERWTRMTHGSRR